MKWWLAGFFPFNFCFVTFCQSLFHVKAKMKEKERKEGKKKMTAYKEYTDTYSYCFVSLILTYTNTPKSGMHTWISKANTCIVCSVTHTQMKPATLEVSRSSGSVARLTARMWCFNFTPEKDGNSVSSLNLHVSMWWKLTEQLSICGSVWRRNLEEE